MGMGIALPLAAQPEFDRVFQSDMVLQRGAVVPVRGKAKPGSEVELTWKGQVVKTQTGADGVWKAELRMGKADAKPATLSARDSEGTAVLENVLVGDVWLASGQSNMEFMVSQVRPGKEKADWNVPGVRLMKVKYLLHTKPGSFTPQQYAAAEKQGFFSFKWQEMNDTTVRDFSAVAAYFARRVQRETGVPIGIICNALGGTGMESWTPESVIDTAPVYEGIRGDGWQSSPDFDAWMRGRVKENLRRVVAAGVQNPVHPFAPAMLYNAALEPLGCMPVKGVLWYQGESNADDHDLQRNATKLSLIIGAWRKLYGNDKLPFFLVQLPRIADPKRPHWGAFRRAQAQVADADPAVDLICTVDLGSTDANVHPPLKEPVGLRLADLVLGRVYGKAVPHYPRVTGSRREGAHLVVQFSEPLKTTDGKPPRGFETATEASGPYAPASAELRGNRVVMPATGGCYWRYNEGTSLDPNLVSKKSALPAFPACGAAVPKQQ